MSVRLMGRVKAPTRTRGTHFSAREMGPVSKARKTGPRHFVYRWILDRKCRDYGLGSRQNPDMARSLNPKKGTESLVTSCVTTC